MVLPSTHRDDGGYYAIKGFLYQFDATIFKIFNNPDQVIQFEQIQDINYEDYVIQVKHKESQNYNDSKIRKAIIQLIDLFEKDNSKKFWLYCHFKDKNPQKKVLKLAELDKILGDQKGMYKRPIKTQFLKNFIIEFSHDYNSQFIKLIEQIKKTYNLASQELALYYHSIFRSKLLELVIKDKEERQISKINLDYYITNVKKVVFHSAYAEYISKEKYENFIRKQFFLIKKMNLDNFERLFIIDTSIQPHRVSFEMIIARIIQKYYRPEKSPAPYICFKNINKDLLNSLKQCLVDREVLFSDGTCFDGDKFRIEKIIINDKNLMVKIINEEYLDEVISKLPFQEVFQFFYSNLHPVNTLYTKHYQIQIDTIEQIPRMIG